jgi:outer membrane protein
MLKNYILNAVLALIISVLSIFVYHTVFTKKEKIAYVRNGVVLSEYKYMQDVSKQFESEMKVAQSNADTLKARYEALKIQEQSALGKDKAKWAYQLGIAENNFQKYTASAEQEMMKRQSELTEKVIAKVNSSIKEYAVKHGYRYVLGTTKEGSILYADPADDITDRLLRQLNEVYLENPKK